MQGTCTGPTYLSKELGRWRKRHVGGHDMVRRMDRQGEVLIWCRKSWGYPRQRKEPKSMNCCKPEQVGTKEYGKMVKRIQIFGDGRIPANEARNWRFEGQKRRITRTTEDCQMSLRWEDSWHRRSMETLQRKILQDRGDIAKGRRRHCQRVQGHARRTFPMQLAEGGCGRYGGSQEEDWESCGNSWG